MLSFKNFILQEEWSKTEHGLEHKTTIDGHAVVTNFDDISSEYMPHAYDLSFTVGGRGLSRPEGGMSTGTTKRIYSHVQGLIKHVHENPPGGKPITHFTYEPAASIKDEKGVPRINKKGSETKSKIMHNIFHRLGMHKDDMSNVTQEPSDYGAGKFTIDLRDLKRN